METKKEFLLNLIKEYYPQGDSYYANQTKKGKWKYGYSNDYPLQHGPGESFIIPDEIVEILINKCK